MISTLSSSQNWLVLTGAGVSADSGVPTYRDKQGAWQRLPPVTHQQFMTEQSARQRFWARNMVGWRFMIEAQPNTAHLALAALENTNAVSHLVTQNVDGLHQRAGSCRVIDLHGRLDTVSCMSCGLRYHRGTLQSWMQQNNPEFSQSAGVIAPDGDAHIDQLDYSNMQIPDCEHCGGILKPDAVFFGDSIPRNRLDEARQQLTSAQGLLVVGSSLAVYSGYRFCLWAQAQGKPIVILNQGTTRADSIASLKADSRCASILQEWLANC
ncbi:MAG: NAD-dependent protein deacetylase [Porticoccaceae bacterium]|nr:NAD-dependent protein deacetylase [Porticoccaceae bacterium]MDG1310930.1 NAD-dependent protein deacetylase [Porticoccaceae bacterium]